MNKLELKHLAPYLPYLLHGFIETRWARFGVEVVGWTYTTLRTNPSIYGYTNCSVKDFKPILHTLSDLVKPCLPEGKIPILELAKIVFDKRDNPDEFFFQSLKENTVFIAFPDKMNVFGYDSNTKSFFGSSSGLATSVVNQLELFEWLFEHHFDVYGLIEQNLAVDINTL